ncbi:tumor necrosis factor receptor superfamily member 11B [Eublepharis macularius]|uniref:Tumor necrosis factor receptor superfamily member 11B n=1 Tax=Eublepharis macularius TaxID=481883 RepID=A0AA97JQI5_EUBMA|nr:tumor necrosis factor receptor superfamily member 11B [Eublepharis macularius]
MNKFLCCTLVLLDISVKSTLQETVPPKHPFYDRKSGRQLMCDQCPAGTYVQKPCTETSKTVCAPCPKGHYEDDWNFDDECFYCSAVCQELQFVRQECSSTQKRICECVEGRYFELEYCAKHTKCPPGFGVVEKGTPWTDTVCERCPEGYFSNESSSTAACQKLESQSRDAKEDNVWQGEKNSKSDQQCVIDVTLCEEAFFRFAVPTKLTPDWFSSLTDSLPGKNITAEALEKIKQRHSPQEQTFQLLKLWKQQNKDHSMVMKIVQDIDLCENSVLKQIGHLNVTPEQLKMLMENLPGEKVSKEENERIVKVCKSAEQIPKLLNLWRIKNRDQDSIKGLMYGLKHLKAYHFPKTTIQGLRKMVKFLRSVTMQKLYQKFFLEMLGNQVHLVKGKSA